MQQKNTSLCAAHILKKMLRKNGAAFSNMAKSGSLLQWPRLYSSQPKSESYDAIVVGGGHNGLVSAAYLAKAGMK